jgi:hypothetical protein
LSALSPSQQPTVLFSIYQNNTWTIRSLVDETIDPVIQRIILKIVGFVVLKLGYHCKGGKNVYIVNTENVQTTNHAKGQSISKADWCDIDSPKKRTDKFVLFAFLLFTANKSNSFVLFLGKSTTRQSAF